MAGNVVEFTDAGFQADVIDSQQPVLVDFWAPWCGPCKRLAPTIEELADEYSGRVRVGKLDIDTNQETAIKYEISSIPTVIIFQGGEIKQKIVGTPRKTTFNDAINPLL